MDQLKNQWNEKWIDQKEKKIINVLINIKNVHTSLNVTVFVYSTSDGVKKKEDFSIWTLEEKLKISCQCKNNIEIKKTKRLLLIIINIKTFCTTKESNWPDNHK